MSTFKHPVARCRSRPRAGSLRTWGIAAAILTIGCGSDSTSPRRARGIVFVSGQNAADTAGALLAGPLLVEIHDSSGAPAPTGTVVRFTTVTRKGSFTPEMTVEPLTGSTYTTLAVGSTDAAGRTAVLVRLGFGAGDGRIAVSVPTLGLLDTARFTIRPAAPVRVTIAPADTTILSGKSFTFRGGAADQYGNTTTDPITWVADSGGAVSNTGTFTATGPGRFRVVATGTKGSAISHISGVPPFRLVAATSFPASVILVDADGSHPKALTTFSDGGIGPHPTSIPRTSSIVFTTLEGGLQTLKVVDTNGVVRPFFATTPVRVTHEAEPEATADGQWLFFSAYDSDCSLYRYCLYRARPDGSGAEPLWPFVGPSTTNTRPAPSPDGSKVAYMTAVTSINVRVLDIVNRSVSQWYVEGDRPSWSPNGQQIAFTGYSGGPISLVNVDGSGKRVLTNHFYSSGAPISWSPDGRWILAKGTFYELIDSSTGIAMPLNFSAS